MSNTELNVYKIVLQEVCENFNGAEQYIKERIEMLCSESKLSAEQVLLKSYKHHLECSVICLIFFALYLL